jgi:hypothetical protein
MLAWWHQSAFRAPIVEDQVSLKVNSGVFELLEPFVFKQLPHFLFGDTLSLLDKFSLIFVEEYRPAKVSCILFLPSNNLINRQDPIWAIVGSQSARVSVQQRLISHSIAVG